jgi:hypothetical protein
LVFSFTLYSIYKGWEDAPYYNIQFLSIFAAKLLVLGVNSNSNLRASWLAGVLTFCSLLESEKIEVGLGKITAREKTGS